MIRAISAIDVFALISTCWRNNKHWSDDQIVLYFRGPPGPEDSEEAIDQIDLPPMSDKSWLTVKNVLRRCRAALTLPERRSPLMQRVFLQRLLPGDTLEWEYDRSEYAREVTRFHLPLVTNPFCNLYCGAAFGHLPVGQLTMIDISSPTSAINMGVTPRLHLVLDVSQDDDTAVMPPAEPTAE